MITKTLEEILGGCEHEVVCGPVDREVTALCYDSRECSPGALFFCIRGFNVDGHEFVAEAVSRGASVLVVEEYGGDYDDVTVIKVADTRRAMGRLAANFFGNPADKLHLLGVTGTNGKTSVAFMADALLRAMGRTTGLLGTVVNRISGEELKVKRTTPESLDLQALLARMAERGCTHASMEVSSHAVVLHRIAGCSFNAGILTNITQDHLDFHKDFDEYFAAKKAFLTDCVDPDGIKVLNRDDAHYEQVREGLAGRVVTYGIESRDADVRAADIAFDGSGISFTVNSTFTDGFRVESGLLGLFNVYNALAIIAWALAEGVSPDIIKSTLQAMPCVPGRFEKVDQGQAFTVVVDYAHTPDGLVNVLQSARRICDGRLIVVFGAGGDRDRSKRPLMGQAAAKLADFAVVTSDNPRTEDPYRIIEQVVGGVELGLEQDKASRKFKYLIEEDRYTAIHAAINGARDNDVIVIAGKGHEDYQIFKDRTIHFDDRVVARKILQERMGHGAADPGTIG